MNRVQEFRLKSNKKVVDFARELGYSESLQRQLECNAKNPSKKYIINFKEKYPEADINYIFFT